MLARKMPNWCVTMKLLNNMDHICMKTITRFFFAFCCIAISTNVGAGESSKMYSGHNSLPLPGRDTKLSLKLSLSGIPEEPSQSEQPSFNNSISPSQKGSFEQNETPSVSKGEMQRGATPTSISVAILLPKRPKHFDFSQEQVVCTPDIEAPQPTKDERVEYFHFSAAELAALANQSSSAGQSSAFEPRKSIRNIDTAKLEKAVYPGHNEPEREESADTRVSKCSLWRCFIACCGIRV